MLLSSQLTTAFTGVLLLGAVVPCAAQSSMVGDKDAKILRLEKKLAHSQRQYTNLAASLATSKEREKELSESLNELRLKFAALGENLDQGISGRKLDAVKDAEVLDKQNVAIQEAVQTMMTNLDDYLRTAIIADSDARLRLERSRRELDVVLGLGQKPRPQVPLGTLHQARIVSIDSDSGALVINAGENQAVEIGMRFSITRGNRKVAEGIVANTVKDFSGVLPTEFNDKMDLARVGDVASIQTIEQ